MKNNYQSPYIVNNSDEERFFFAPFLIGGLAGTALGYGIANNNQINGSNMSATTVAKNIGTNILNSSIDNNSLASFVKNNIDNNKGGKI